MSGRGGPEKCRRPCVECSDGRHHFSAAMVGFADDEPDHEAAKAGHESWFECKHCEAWIADMEDDNGAE